MDLETRELTLSTGQKAQYEYDSTGDTLEIIFRQGEATAAIELTESIILRFDWDNDEPLSLSFMSFSKLIQPAEFGEMHFQLLMEEWPDGVQEKIFAMLRTPPLTDFLSLSSYAPAHTPKVVPAATIKPPHLAPLTA